jgi:hypothetical protein
MRRTVGALGAVALVLTGCGLPDDDQPRVIAAADAPIDLVPTTVSMPEQEGVDVFVFFVVDGRLQRVERQVPEATPEAIWEVLLAGPTESEEQLTTSIPPSTTLNGPELDRASGTLTLDLGPDLENSIFALPVDGQALAFAQIVWTMTRIAGIGYLRFELNGVAQQATTVERGAKDVVNIDDYPLLGPGGG